MGKITCMTMTRGKPEAHYNDFSLSIFRGMNADGARLEVFYCKSPARAKRITNLFLAWLIKAGDKLGVL
jgi:hypothetical protein